MLNRIMNDESGVLTFEWILLITLLVIGIVGGLAVVRDAYIIEAAETGDAMLALNQSYTIEQGLQAKVVTTGPGVGMGTTTEGEGDNATDVDVTTFAYVASTGYASNYIDAAGEISVTTPTYVRTAEGNNKTYSSAFQSGE